MSWKKVILLGFIIGTILGIAAYFYLWTVGNQLKAEAFARNTESRYAQIALNARLGVESTNMVPIVLNTNTAPLRLDYEDATILQPTYNSQPAGRNQ